MAKSYRFSQEVIKDRMIRMTFNYLESEAWKKLTEIMNRNLKLSELIQIIKQVEKRFNIKAERIEKRYLVPSIKFLNDHWHIIEPYVCQIISIPENETNCNFKNYDVFDPNSEIALNSRNVENQDQQSNDRITGDFWSDDNDTTQIKF